MAALADHETPRGDATQLERVATLLGGVRLLRHRLRSQLEVHEALNRGLPGAAVNYLIDRLVVIREPDSIEKATGMSLRTLQRRKLAPSKPLNQEQSGRTWKFAEILAKATAIFGSQDEAEHWLERPAIGLDRRRPIDLLATPAGVRIVEDLLERLEFGVYA
jgi:putative toxin-antitoxin system antitoxin component (TIGR02293 family)